jgi:hypothetical protein
MESLPLLLPFHREHTSGMGCWWLLPRRYVQNCHGASFDLRRLPYRLCQVCSHRVVVLEEWGKFCPVWRYKSIWSMERPEILDPTDYEEFCLAWLSELETE